MNPTCNQCGYDMSGTERCEEGYVCPECGMAHEAKEHLYLPTWPGWARLLFRASVPLLLVTLSAGLWLGLLPWATRADGRGDLVLATVWMVPLLTLAAAVWGPTAQARRLWPFDRSRHSLNVSRRRFIVIGLAVTLGLLVGLWIVGGSWATGQLILSMPD